MVVNDFENDFKKLRGMSGKTQVELAAEMGVSQPNVARIAKGKIIPQKYVELCERMGYDIKVVYVKHEE